MRYSLVKVLLTVSPFRPSFPTPLHPFPRSPRAVSPLSTAFTPNRPLTPLSTAFTETHRGVGYPDLQTFRRSGLQRHLAPGKSVAFILLRALVLSLRSFLHALSLFSIVCGLFSQNTRGGGTSVTPQRSLRLGVVICRRFLFPHCFPAIPFLSHPSALSGSVGDRSPSQVSKEQPDLLIRHSSLSSPLSSGTLTRLCGVSD